MKPAIIYLHGFNSASLDLSGQLLISKQKLLVLDQFCIEKKVKFFSPNVDYRDYQQVISYLSETFNQLSAEGYKVLFMGSSLGGFTSEYMAMKMGTQAIMINPAILPSELLKQFIGLSENFETHQSYDWTIVHCLQYKKYEDELAQQQYHPLKRTILLDMADELIDSKVTVEKYDGIANIVTYEGGSHGFEHMEDALPVLEKVIFDRS